ncbi:MAG: response regulator transcription factor, partial [Pseudomonadales bacterium]|nr:response regulator transcription factor [Pseudomonadales bacterium]
MRALVIEDEPAIRQSLVNMLEGAGYACDAASDGEEGLFCASEYPIDIAIVDLGLPGMNGMDLVRELRERGRDLPILILTARDGWQDKVAGLEAGADDYLVKPFHRDELLARLNALLRRSSGHASPRVTYGALSVDTAAQTARANDATLTLTAYEYKVLEYLLHNAGAVLSKTELAEHIYAEESDRDSNVIEVFVGRLRKKIAAEGVEHNIE